MAEHEADVTRDATEADVARWTRRGAEAVWCGEAKMALQHRLHARAGGEEAGDAAHYPARLVFI